MPVTRRGFVGRVLVVLIMFLVSTSATCAYSVSSMTWDDIKELRSLTTIAETIGLGIPNNLHGKRDAYVFITAAAGYTKVSIVSYWAPADKLSDVLSRALRVGGLTDALPTHGTAGTNFAATALVANPRYGARFLTNRAPVGAIVRSIRSSGLAPHVLLRIPRYAEAQRLGLPSLVRPRFVWYNTTDCPRDFVVTTSVAVPLSLIALLTYVRILLPALGVSAFLFGVASGLNRKLPVAKRIWCFDWIGIMAPFAAGAACAASGIAFERSVFERLISDAWFANPSNDHVFFDVYISFALLLIVAPICGLVMRRRIFRGLDEEPDVVDLASLLERARMRGLTVALAFAAFAAYLVIARPLVFNHWETLSHPSSLAPGIIGPVIALFMSWDMWRPSTLDVQLTARAKELAPLFGVDVREVRVVKNRYGRRNANGCALIGKKRICITERAAREFSPGQMDWLLAHELVHFRDHAIYRGTIRRLTLPSAVVALLLTVLYLLGGSANSLLLLWLVGLVPVGVLVAVNDSSDIRRRLEYEADIQGFLAIGDLEASVSALRAMAVHSENPKVHDEELDEHPKLCKRIKAVRAAAGQMGVSETPVR